MRRRIVANLLAAWVLVAVAGAGLRPAAEVPTGLGAAVAHSPGLRIATATERVASLLGSAPDLALDRADELLSELRVRATDTEDVLGAVRIRELAVELVGLRARAATELGPLPPGARGAFVQSLLPGATLADWAADIPASITLAQAILESGWGRSAPGNNLFGVKGTGPAGTERRRVVEYREGRRAHRRDLFRRYESVDQALEDHGRLLATSPRYEAARAAGEDRAAFAAALVGRYASDPRYAEKLLGLIDRWQLGRFDVTAPAGWRPTSPLPPIPW
jgi:hypothetical protein